LNGFAPSHHCERGATPMRRRGLPQDITRAGGPVDQRHTVVPLLIAAARESFCCGCRLLRLPVILGRENSEADHR
jgi:hypothetical protein